MSGERPRYCPPVTDCSRNISRAGDSTDVSRELTSDVKVRFLNLPPKKDEKGKPIPYTEKEKKELKGEGNKKGYKADREDLTPGKIVTG